MFLPLRFVSSAHTAHKAVHRERARNMRHRGTVDDGMVQKRSKHFFLMCMATSCVLYNPLKPKLNRAWGQRLTSLQVLAGLNHGHKSTGVSILLRSDLYDKASLVATATPPYQSTLGRCGDVHRVSGNFVGQRVSLTAFSFSPSLSRCCSYDT